MNEGIEHNDLSARLQALTLTPGNVIAHILRISSVLLMVSNVRCAHTFLKNACTTVFNIIYITSSSPIVFGVHRHSYRMHARLILFSWHWSHLSPLPHYQQSGHLSAAMLHSSAHATCRSAACHFLLSPGLGNCMNRRNSKFETSLPHLLSRAQQW